MNVTQAEWLALRMEWLKAPGFITFTEWLARRDAPEESTE